MALTYKQAGVDIDAGDALVERIKPLAARTRIPEVLADVGGFAGLCRLPTGMKEPILVSGTDGVGTKLKLAFMLDKHDTVGIDLVAMCVNDIITVGARPLFFLDYFATGALDVDRAAAVVSGIARGCELAGCALLGGETAELPGFYEKGEYDLAGFVVGVVDRAALLDGKAVREGDVVIGVASSGLHSNGYSLVRKALFDVAQLRPDSQVEGLHQPLGAALLEPTKIYAKLAKAVLATGGIHAMSHITGGGLPGNIPRVLPDGLGVEIKKDAWQRPALFNAIAKLADVPEVEMRRTFNLGIGLVLIVAKESVHAVTQACEGAGERCFIIGQVGSAPGAVDDDRVQFV